MFDQKFGVFHRAILAFFVLIFSMVVFAGCGYKDDPFYDEGTKPQKEKKVEKINKL
ncbi:hypothetical protein [Campylobacter curvus]|uniref:hypothetical protein n=1 Tax=Campylobacter curvus TaxID=200 RepID=UPI0014705417|nr:hypothetical protein [Campylobacter curvus]